MNISSYIRTVPNFPKKGIMFKDITTLIKDPIAFDLALNSFYNLVKNKEITKVVGIESRGFIFGAALASKLGVGFIPIRKPGKLPAETIEDSYSLEYGID